MTKNNNKGKKEEQIEKICNNAVEVSAVCASAIETFGVRPQLIVAIEELSELEERVFELEAKIYNDEKYKGFQSKIEPEFGNFFVFNPKKGQPHRVYKDYASAYADGKDVSKKEQNPVYILKLLTLIVPKYSFETIDISTKGIPENYVDDVIPF